LRNLSFRTLLFLGFILVILTTGLCSTFIGVHMVGKNIVPAAENKVRVGLNTARGILEEVNVKVRDVIRITADRFFLHEALENEKIEEMISVLDGIRHKEGLDFLTITDPEGKVILRARNPGQKGYLLNSRKLLEEILSSRNAISSIEVLSQEDLKGEGGDFAKRAFITIAPTPYSRKMVRKGETSGLCLIGVAPILNKLGEVRWMLWGGKLLNHDYRIIEGIRGTVSEDQKYRDRDVCSVSISLGDVRISANIKKDNGESSVGTLLSEEVYNHVFLSGEKWLKRAFVVNDYYIKAYEPIRNMSGTIIGVLGLGLLEREFKQMERDALTLFLGITFGGVVLAVAICIFLTRLLMNPFNVLMNAKKELAAGNLNYSFDLKKCPKEIAELGRALNRMAEAISERDEQLRRRAQEEIRRSERLAMIGRLASGVAHEINNPLGSILLFSRLLLQKAPPEGLQRENLERIERETKRCQNIVQGLLDFAKKREPKAKLVTVNKMADETITLFENHPMLHNVEIVRQYQQGLPEIFVDPNQIMQVFANIIMNAVDAMKGQGRMTIETAVTEDHRYVEIRFSDTGDGIPPEVMERVFDPFFTTKGVGQGTGLGLSVSHGIVEMHGGTIKVRSILGKGTTFTISLPVNKESG
jgi:two-component system NtrC family sensor kinase